MRSTTHFAVIPPLFLCAVVLCAASSASASEWVQSQKLLASDGARKDWFGLPVAISGDRMVIAATGDDDDGAESGSAYVFVRTDDGWEEATKLRPLDGAAGRMFGDALAIEGGRIVAGTRSGELAYVFDETPGGWQQSARLTAGVTTDTGFGDSIAFNGDMVVVGAYANAGAVYVFERDGTAWASTARLTNPVIGDSNQFGWAVAAGDGFVMIAASGDFGRPAPLPGAVYVFERDGENWTSTDRLASGEEHFGCAIAVSGERAIVGTLEECAYIFEKSADGWEQVARLTAPGGEPGDRFGWSVALDGDRAVVGAFAEDAGAAYVFERTGPEWVQVARLTASDGQPLDYFAYSVSVGGATVLVGAQAKSGVSAAMGAAYVFREKPASLPGDANDDGKVDSADLAAWQRNYDPIGDVGNTFGMGDFNGDTKIDSTDLAIWQQHYEPIGSIGGTVTQVPEPTMVALFLPGALAGAAVRARRKK